MLTFSSIFLSHSHIASGKTYLIKTVDKKHQQTKISQNNGNSDQGRHCPILAVMARVETPVLFTYLISFLSIFSCFLPLCHRILPIVSPVFEIFETPGIAIAIPAILVSPPLSAVRCDWGRAGRRFDCDNKLDCTDQDLNSLQLVVLPSRPANNRIYFWQ